MEEELERKSKEEINSSNTHDNIRCSSDADQESKDAEVNKDSSSKPKSNKDVIGIYIYILYIVPSQTCSYYSF